MLPELSAFSDELVKISNAYLRSGKRPISVDKYLENEATDNVGTGPETLAESSAVQSKISAVLVPLAAGAVGGALALHQGKKAVKDWRLGREIRQQQEAQGNGY